MESVDVGLITGRASPTRFNIKASASVRKGEYVVAQHEQDGLVLGVVKSVVRDERGLTAEVKVIGSRNNKGVLQAPKHAFSPNARVWKADQAIIANTIGLAADKQGVFLGNLESYSLPVKLNPVSLSTKHVAILAMSGSGKSYATGVLIEELADSGFPVVVIDPHGEYATLSEENDEEKDVREMPRFGIKPKSFDVREYSLSGRNKLTVDGRRLKSKDIAGFLPIKLNASQQGCLYQAVKIAKNSSMQYDLSDVKKALDGTEANAKWPVLSALDEVIESNLFSSTPTKLSDLIKTGQVTLVNLKGAAFTLQQAAVARLLADLFHARKNGLIPAFFLVLEEAHNFCPERSFGEVPCSAVTRTIASEGRKFGLGLCVVTQRPARIDKSVLSQCNTQIVLKMTNPHDLKAVSGSMESFDETTEETIKTLTPGTAIVAGEAVEHNVVVEVRVRKSKHGGKAPTALELPETASDVQEKIARCLHHADSATYHPFWVLGNSQGDFLIDALHQQIYIEEKNTLLPLMKLTELELLDDFQASALNQLASRKEVYSTDLSSIAKENKTDSATIEKAFKQLASRKLVQARELGNLKVFSLAFDFKKTKFLEDGPSGKKLVDKQKTPVTLENIYSASSQLPALNSLSFIHLPVYLEEKNGGKELKTAYC